MQTFELKYGSYRVPVTVQNGKLYIRDVEVAVVVYENANTISIGPLPCESPSEMMGRIRDEIGLPYNGDIERIVYE